MHFLYYNIVQWTRRKLQWNFNQNTKLFIHENASENIVRKTAAVFSRGRWVKLYVSACHIDRQCTSPVSSDGLVLNKPWKHIVLIPYYQGWGQVKYLYLVLGADYRVLGTYLYLAFWNSRGWVGLWGFLWWAPLAKKKDHGVSSGWSSVWHHHHSNTGLSCTQYEQIPIILGVWPFWLTPFFFRSITFWRAYG